MYEELKTFIIAMSPIVELRGSIPIALEVYNLPVWSSYFWSVLGNVTPVVFILILLKSVSEYLSGHSHYFNNFFTWLFQRTRNHHWRKFERWGKWALFILVAVPLPFTGIWTGSIAAFVFGIPIKKALPIIFAGSITAGLLVLLLTLGIINIV